MTGCSVQGSCHGCCHAVNRRSFLKRTATTVGGLTSPGGAAASDSHANVRVAAAFLANIKIREIRPYPSFDTEGRQREVLALLRDGCPHIEFVPMTVESPNDVPKALALKDQVDGYLIYAMTLDWSQRSALVQIGQLGKPTPAAAVSESPGDAVSRVRSWLHTVPDDLPPGWRLQNWQLVRRLRSFATRSGNWSVTLHIDVSPTSL